MTTPVNARRWVNWGGNQQAVAVDVLTPGTVDEVAAQVKEASGARRKIKVVGSGHSFTDIALADDQRMLLHRLNGLISIDGPLVTVAAGMPLSRLNALLAEHGLAVPNLGDIDEQTVAGAISTGTHGTGAKHSTIASCVEAVKLVNGVGEVVTIGPGDPLLPAVRVSLGALGILVEVTLRCTEAFTLLADERPMALRDVMAGLDEWIGGNDHAEFYWYPYTDRAQLKINNKVPDNDRPLSRFRGWLDDDFLSNSVFGAVCRLGRAVPATVPPISALAARALTARAYTERSDKVFCTPRRVHFTEMEYEIPRAALPEVLSALPRIIDGLPFRVQFPVEVRFTGPDDIW
ncbi:MAG TPA: D-arabinono-1,4-lactone oxidase, partial [Actinoplanes sp.]